MSNPSKRCVSVTEEDKSARRVWAAQAQNFTSDMASMTAARRTLDECDDRTMADLSPTGNTASFSEIYSSEKRTTWFRPVLSRLWLEKMQQTLAKINFYTSKRPQPQNHAKETLASFPFQLYTKNIGPHSEGALITDRHNAHRNKM